MFNKTGFNKNALVWAIPFALLLGGLVYRHESRYIIKTTDDEGQVRTSDIRGVNGARLLDMRTNQEVRWSPDSPRTLLIFLSGAECSSCLDEIRVWQRLATQFPSQQLSVVAVLVRATHDDAASFVSSVKPAFRVLLDVHDEADSRVHVPAATPFKVLIDRAGVPVLAAAPTSLLNAQNDFGNLVAANVKKYVARE